MDGMVTRNYVIITETEIRSRSTITATAVADLMYEMFSMANDRDDNEIKNDAG
jgi:hypothetical protein